MPCEHDMTYRVFTRMKTPGVSDACIAAGRATHAAFFCTHRLDEFELGAPKGKSVRLEYIKRSSRISKKAANVNLKMSMYAIASPHGVAYLCHDSQFRISEMHRGARISL